MIYIKRQRASLNIQVPVDAEGIWQAIQYVETDGGFFTIHDIDAECDAPRHIVIDYVRRLEKAGVVKKVNRTGQSYLIVSRPRAAPSTRPEHQHLWTAMRSLKSFTLGEVVFAATTDTQKIAKVAARRYVGRLVDAGYLAAGPRVGSERTTVYRLKPKMNTGPFAPVVLQLVSTFDRNTHTVINDVAAQECGA